MSCEELHAVLHLVLQAGNILNAVSEKKKHSVYINWTRNKQGEMDGGWKKKEERMV